MLAFVTLCAWCVSVARGTWERLSQCAFECVHSCLQARLDMLGVVDVRCGNGSKCIFACVLACVHARC